MTQRVLLARRHADAVDPASTLEKRADRFTTGRLAIPGERERRRVVSHDARPVGAG